MMVSGETESPTRRAIEIRLNNGQYAIADEEDYDFLAQWRWGISFSGSYVVRKEKEKRIYMHRVVNQTPPGMITDHVNGNKLDNRKVNLRTVNHSQNGCNRGLQRNNSSGFKGVSWHQGRSKWQAHIKSKGKELHLGWFDTTTGAAIAYNNAAIKHHGEFACLNEIPEREAL